MTVFERCITTCSTTDNQWISKFLPEINTFETYFSKLSPHERNSIKYINPLSLTSVDIFAYFAYTGSNNVTDPRKLPKIIISFNFLFKLSQVGTKVYSDSSLFIQMHHKKVFNLKKRISKKGLISPITYMIIHESFSSGYWKFSSDLRTVLTFLSSFSFFFLERRSIECN